jgi:hypothetical protein
MDFNQVMAARIMREAKLREALDTPRRMESWLRQAGLSKGQAKALLSGGWKAYEGAPAQDDGGDTRDAGQDVPDDALADWLMQAAARHQ